MILPMARLELLGPRDLLPRALAFVQAQGVLELREPAPAAEGGAPLFRLAAPAPSERDREQRLADALGRIEALASRLPVAEPAPAAAMSLPEPGSEALVSRLAALESELASLKERRRALLAERDLTERFCRLVVAVAPLRHGLDSAVHPEFHGVMLRNDPQALALLRSEVDRLTRGACDVTARPVDEELTGVLVVVPRAHGRAVTALLVEHGVDEVRLPSRYEGKPLVDVLLLLAERSRTLPEELAAVETALRDLAAALGPALQSAAARVNAGLDRLRARGRCGETRFAFVVAGYMPEERVPELREAAARELGDRVTVLTHPPEHDAWPEVPVVLRNRPWVRPFERLLSILPLPRYGSVDPTPWVAVFFPVFFGLILGDVFFGAVGALAALAVRARGWGGSAGRDLAWIALWCSLSAIAFGLLFGEALGELGEHLGLRPVLLDRRHAVMGLLGLALATGSLHVSIGIALGIATALRGGHRREAARRATRLLLLGAGGAFALAAAGHLPRGTLVPSAVAALTLLAVAVAVEGPMAALEVVLGLGNVLSYARLMALGLASLMLAHVANVIWAKLEPAAIGCAVAVLLHAVNFTLGLVSPTIAALRLHYVEFFEKFYDGGGAPYRPFALAA